MLLKCSNAHMVTKHAMQVEYEELFAVLRGLLRQQLSKFLHNDWLVAIVYKSA